MTRCRPALDTHYWRNIERTLLGLYDCDGFYECFLIWECVWCSRRVWADGVLHTSTPALSPVEWMAVIKDHHNPWQQYVDVLRRQQHQQETVQATIQRWTVHNGRA